MKGPRLVALWMLAPVAAALTTGVSASALSRFRP
jgi:hypothetical protein